MDDLSGNVVYISGSPNQHMVLQACDVHRRGDKDYYYYDLVNLGNYNISRRVPQGNIFKTRTIEHLQSIVDNILEKQEKASRETQQVNDKPSLISRLLKKIL
jgi:hypothetical protein